MHTRYLYLLLVISSLFCSPRANAAGWSWAEGFGGKADETPGGIVKDAAGNIYMTGNFVSKTVSFGTYTLTNSDTSGGTSDVFLVKYDPSGTVMWARSAGGLSVDQGLSMAIDKAGHIYIAGLFTSASITFGTVTLNCASGNGDMFVFKLDSSGNGIWGANTGSASAIAQANAVAVDTSGNVYVAGIYETPTITFGTTTLTNAGSWPMNDVFLVKYGPTGSAVWARSIGGSNDEEVFTLSTDPAGNVFIAGFFSTASLTIGTATLTNVGSSDIFLAKYDAAGTPGWARTWGGSNGEEVRALKADDSGNVYMAGTFGSPTITFGATTLTNLSTGVIPTDVYLVKVDASGNVVWTTGAGGTGMEMANSLVIDWLGNVLMGGYFFSTAVSFGTYTLTNTASSNMYITKYSPGGNVLWAVSGDAGSTGVSAMTVGEPGNIYVAGTFSGTSCTLGSTTLPNLGIASNSDMFLAKYRDSTVTTGTVTLSEDMTKVNVYPNPNNGKMTVSLGMSGCTSVAVYDIFGKIVYSRGITVTEKSISIDMENCASGMYYLQATTDGSVTKVPFVLTR